ncbi:MAG: YhdP family protein [Pseudomonadota bacterium]|nr:YhdP family protein [Pseudomonadota bacterium]
MRWLTRIVATLAVLLVLGALALHWVIVPRIDDFRPRLEALASRVLATPVTIGALRAESNGLVPSVSLHDVQVHDPTGRPGLRVPRVLAAFSVWSLARGALEQLVIEQPELELRRTAEGRLLMGGLDLSGDASGDTGAADWFFSQPEFLVLGGRVRWVDEQREVTPVALNEVQIVMRNGHRRHQMRVDATPDVAWGERFTLVGQFRQPVFSRHAGYWQEWDGQVYADFGRVDVSRLRQYVDLKTEWGVDLRRGSGALRLWADVQRGQPTEATADLALGAVEVAFGPTLKPLAFASLTGRVGWRDAGGALSVGTEGLQFVDADGLAWPGGNVQLSLREPSPDTDAGAGQGGGELSGDQLDLAVLAKIASRLPLPPAVHRHLQDHPVQGRVQTLHARWDGPLDAPTDWRVQARVSALSVGARPAPPGPRGEPVEGIPGIEGAAIELTTHPAGGEATLAIRDGALTFPGVFEQPRIPLTRLNARANWQVQGERVALQVEELSLANADATGSFKASWRTFDAIDADAEGRRFPGVLDLQGSFSRANGARIHRYLPLGVPADARRYVREAVQKGEAHNVSVRVKGDLRQVARPSPAPGTEFRFAGQVRGTTLNYVPPRLQPEGQAPWPALHELAGELVFEHASMRVNKASARVQGHPGWRFTGVQASIDDLAHTRVRLRADGSGPLATALDIVRTSPLAGFTQHALDRASATGDAQLRLKLDLPIDDIQHAKAEGRITLAGNALRVTPDAPLLTQAQGELHFSDTGFTLHEVQAQLLGGHARVSGGTPSAEARAAGAPAVQVQVRGTATAEALREMHDWAPLPALARQASGSAAYEAMLGFGAGAPQVVVTSDLHGMAFDLPEPLNKPADASWPLRYESQDLPSRAGTPARDRLRLRVADLLALEYERDTRASPARVVRGAMNIGAANARALPLPASGVAARVQLPRVSVEAWEGALTRVFGPPTDAAPGAAAESGYVPTAWTLKVDELLWDERTLHAVSASGTRAGRTWRADVQAQELAGQLEYSEGGASGAGHLRARLDRLSIPASRGADDPPSLAEPHTRIPSLDVVVQHFELRGMRLGELRVQAVNRDAASARNPGTRMRTWQLTQLGLHMPEATLSAHGQWATPGAQAGDQASDARRTELDFTLDVRDAGALLARVDMPGVLSHGEGHLHGRLAWAGAPFSPHYASMGGQLHLEMGQGQFLKVDPGMAKLLGVLSLQALPRRLSLDFRDLFATGFAFDFIRGDVRLAQGEASSHNLQMKGASATVLMDGNADLGRETQNLRVLVVPQIDAGTAALVATAINPAIGISAFIAQLVLQKPLAKAATREFHITGTWDDPQVEQIGAREPDTDAPGVER